MRGITTKDILERETGKEHLYGGHIVIRKFAKPQKCTLAPCRHLSHKFQAVNKVDQLGAWALVGTEGPADAY